MHLVDEVLPKVAMRQWVLTVPWELRARLGYDRRACALMCRAFSQALHQHLRRKAKQQLTLRSVTEAHPGSVTFVQRCDASLRLSPHLHTLALDGVYVRDDDGELVFHELGDPDDEDVTAIAEQVAERVLGHLELDDADAVMADEPLLAHCLGASATGTDALGPRRGKPALRLVDPRRVRPQSEGPARGLHRGFAVYADRGFDGNDRQRLFRMCRYLARPPVAKERVSVLSDGRVCYRLKQPFRDGTTAVVLSPVDFIGRLAALVPPPRFHLVRYAGVLSSHSSLRPKVVSSGQPKLQRPRLSHPVRPA